MNKDFYNNLPSCVCEILEDLLFVTTLPNVSIKLSEEKLIQLKDYITNLQEENEDLQYYKKIIDKIIIIKDYPYKEDSDYVLCNMSKQELYKLLCKSRERIYKGVDKDEN